MGWIPKTKITKKKKCASINKPLSFKTIDDLSLPISHHTIMNSHRKLIRFHGQECMNLGELLPELHPTLTSRCEFHCHQSPSRETRREDREAGHKYTSAVAQCETLYWCSSEIWFNGINIHASCCLCYWPPLFQTISDLLTKHINCCNKIHLKETGLDPGVPCRTHTRGCTA